MAKSQLYTYVPQHIADEVKRQAEECGVSKSEIVRQALAMFLENTKLIRYGGPLDSKTNLKERFDRIDK